MNIRLDIMKRKKDIIELIKNKRPKAEIYRMLKCKAVTLERYLCMWNIVYKGNRGLKNIKISTRKKLVIEYFKQNISIHSNAIKKKLIEEGYKNKECEKCKKKRWNRKEIPLELHHVDGNKYNNILKNLMILCPNCHAQEPTNSGKNIGSYK